MDTQFVTSYPALSQYADDLTLQIAEGRISPSINPEDDFYVQRVFQVLHRRHKNDPILVCDDRLRRLAVVHEVARCLLKEELPDGLATSIRRVWVFRHDLFFADAENFDVLRGRLIAVLDDLQSSRHQITLFVDDLHLLVGTLNDQTRYVGQPFVIAHARGEINFMGATSPENYRQHIDTHVFPHLTQHAQALMMEPT